MPDLFETHLVDSPASVASFSAWVQGCAEREETLAVAIRDRQNKLAFSSRDDAYVLDCGSPAGIIALGVVREMVLVRGQLKLTSRNLTWDLVTITKYLAKKLDLSLDAIFSGLSQCYVGDLTAASHCINQTVTPMKKFRLIEQDAFEVGLLLPQYETGIPDYYTKIGIPLAKLVAEAALLAPKATAEWFVSYDYLWLKTLAYYSNDPTLGWAIYEGRNPIDAVATMFKCTPDEAETLLLWQACGRDMEAFRKRFPKRVALLPPDLNSWDEATDRAMPTLSYAVSEMRQAYRDSRSAETMYGRRLRPNHPIGDAVAFRVFGTVEELISIAACTAWNNRTSRGIMIVGFRGGPAEPIIRLEGVGGGNNKLAWLSELQNLMPLANPLGSLTLNPQVLLL